GTQGRLAGSRAGGQTSGPGVATTYAPPLQLTDVPGVGPIVPAAGVAAGAGPLRNTAPRSTIPATRDKTFIFSRPGRCDLRNGEEYVPIYCEKQPLSFLLSFGMQKGG